MFNHVIRRAESWEGRERIDILRGMTDRQLATAATRLLQFERGARQATRSNPGYLATCRRDVREVIGEMLRRDPRLEKWGVAPA